MSQHIKKGQKFSVQKMNDIYEIVDLDSTAGEVHVVMDGLSKVFKVPYDDIKEAFDTGFYIPYEEQKTIQGTQDGMHCTKCKQFFPYAESNQPDGSLKCYKCRNGL